MVVEGRCMKRSTISVILEKLCYFDIRFAEDKPEFRKLNVVGDAFDIAWG